MKTLSVWPILILVTLCFARPAAGATQQDLFLEALASAYAHYRSASSYLRTGNAALAALELEQAQEKWRALRGDFETTPPDSFAADALWQETLRDVSTAFDQALAATDDGDLKAAGATLSPVRSALADLRGRNKVTTFSDRIDEISAAMERLWIYRHEPPDFAAPETAKTLSSRIAVFSYLLGRARESAPKEVSESAEFKRLISGALEGTERLWLAMERKDETLLINTLRELRSFEQILFFRFG